MEVQGLSWTSKQPPTLSSDAAKQEPPATRRNPSALGWTVFLFAIFWTAFYGLSRGLPYLKNGSDIVFAAKLQWEHKGLVFPADPAVTRVLIFGNSKILAGFVPAWFDQMSLAEHLRVSSFNSGFPGSDYSYRRWRRCMRAVRLPTCCCSLRGTLIRPGAESSISFPTITP